MRTLLAIALLVASSVAYPSTAAAQGTSWHATLNGDVAVTDNVYSAPTGGRNRDGDLVFQLRPGFLFARNARRIINNFTAEAEIVHYAFNSRVPSVSGNATWRAFFLTTPRTELSTSLGVSSGIMTSLSSRLSADETSINITPVGQLTYMSASAEQSAGYILSRDWRVGQRLYGRWSDSTDNAEDRTEGEVMNTTVESLEGGGGLSLSRSFKTDTLSLQGGAAVSRMHRRAPETVIPGPSLLHQWMPRGSAQWRHDINRRLSFTLDGGAVYVIPFGVDIYNPMRERRRGLFPVAGGQFSVSESWGRGTLTLRRDVAPNLLLGQNTLNHVATIAGAVPLPWAGEHRRRSPKLAAIGSVSVVRTRVINEETAGLKSSLGAARLDVAVLYTPRPGVVWGGRFEFMYQTGDERALERQVQGYFRNTIYFTYSIRYPDRVAGVVPKRRAGQTQDNNQQDIIPVGAEPVIPDIIEGTEGGDER